MIAFSPNLSTKPFPNYRLVGLVLISVLAFLVFLSAWQVSGFVRFSSLSTELRREEQNTRVEWEGLGQRLSSLESRINRPESSARLEEVQFLNSLIARKSFSWTRIFQDLENIVPAEVHLLSLQPEFPEGGDAVLLRLDARGRSISDVSGFIESLERSPVFENVVVSIEDRPERGGAGVDIKLTVDYHPRVQSRTGGAP